jgi:hypothetical protein
VRQWRSDRDPKEGWVNAFLRVLVPCPCLCHSVDHSPQSRDKTIHQERLHDIETDSDDSGGHMYMNRVPTDDLLSGIILS